MINKNYLQDTPPTPALENICNQVQRIDPHFDPFAALIHLNQVEEDCHYEHGEQYIETIGNELHNVGSYHEIQDGNPIGEDISRSIGDKEIFIARETCRKRLFNEPWNWMCEDHGYSNKKWRQEYLTQEDIQFMKVNFHGKFSSIDKIFQNHKWLKLEKNEVNPEESKLLCGHCSTYRDEMKIRPQDSDKIALNGIKLDNFPSHNEQKLKDHEKGHQHLRTTEFLKEKLMKEIESDDYLLTHRQDSGSKDCASTDAYVITDRMMLSVYAEIQLNIAFRRHYEIINLQVLNGLNMVRYV